MAKAPKSNGGVCTWGKPRPDLENIGHHPLITLVRVERQMRTYYCKSCEREIVVHKNPKLL